MEMYMEDTGSITASMITLMQERLLVFGITMPVEQEDEIWDEIFNRIELLCPNDYRRNH
jgi:hypothetical protein